MKIILRTHGGLGNQLFQVLYGRLLANKYNANLVCIHDAKYQHNFQLCEEFELNIQNINWFEKLISSARIPKIMEKFFNADTSRFKLFNRVFLDGYFQNINFFKDFKEKDISEQLALLRKELDIDSNYIGDNLVHFRLGDFFNDDNKAFTHVKQRLDDIKSGSTIITNQESIFKNPEISEYLNKKLCKLHSTLDFDAQRVLRLMSSYRNINANDSTMVFWASVLGGSSVEFREPKLAILLSFLKQF